MADSPQNPPLHAGYVVRRVLPPATSLSTWLCAPASRSLPGRRTAAPGWSWAAGRPASAAAWPYAGRAVPRYAAVSG